MESEIKINKKGDICSPKGFLSGSIFSGIKSPGQDKRDIGIIYSKCIRKQAKKKLQLRLLE